MGDPPRSKEVLFSIAQPTDLASRRPCSPTPCSLSVDSGWVRLPGPEVRRRQVEVQAGDEAHEDPHHDAGFGAQHEGVGEAEDLVGQEAGGDAEDQPAGFFVRRPGVDAPCRADEGRPQGDVGDEAGDAQIAYCVLLSLHHPISGTDSPRQIFRASLFGISVWRGTASTSPVFGFAQSECDRPSRLR